MLQNGSERTRIIIVGGRANKVMERSFGTALGSLSIGQDKSLYEGFCPMHVISRNTQTALARLNSTMYILRTLSNTPNSVE